jgi:hypothetical protein
MCHPHICFSLLDEQGTHLSADEAESSLNTLRQEVIFLLHLFLDLLKAIQQHVTAASVFLNDLNSFIERHSHLHINHINILRSGRFKIKDDIPTRTRTDGRPERDRPTHEPPRPRTHHRANGNDHPRKDDQLPEPLPGTSTHPTTTDLRSAHPTPTRKPSAISLFQYCQDTTSSN